MLFRAIPMFFASFVATAIAHADGLVRTSASNAMSQSQAEYPPSGLLDSVRTMRMREELYQSQLVADREILLPTPNLRAGGILASIQSTENLYSSLSLSGIDDPIINTSCPLITQSYKISAATTMAPTILTGLPVPPRMAKYETPQTSNATQPHVLISIVWILAISFIIGMTLYTALNGLGSFVLFFLVLNVICAVIVGAQAGPEPRRRPIGGLRPGPIGKIPCGPLRGSIGTKQGHEFAHGINRKVGGLRPLIEELMCDDWSNAKSLFGRGLAIPTIVADEGEETTTIYTTTRTTVWLTVEDTAMQSQTMTSKNPSPTLFDAPASALATIAKPTPSLVSLNDLAKIKQESSALPPAVNIQNSAFNLFLLSLLGIVICLLSCGTLGALSYVIAGLSIIAMVYGAEAVAIPDPIGLHYSVGWRVPGLRPTKDGKVSESSEVTMWNNTQTFTGSGEVARLRNICGEVYCHNWPSRGHATPIQRARKPPTTYANLVKRLSTEYVTVTPTSGIIGIVGPQIISVTVETTAYENVIVSTVDIETVRSTRTKVVTVLAPETTAFGIQTVSKTDGMERSKMRTLPAVPSDEVQTTSVSSSAEEKSIAEGIERATVFVTTMAPPLPASTSFITTTVIAQGSSSSSPDDHTLSLPTNQLPSAAPSPTALPATSSASHLDSTKLYLSFIKTNLYCFFLLFLVLTFFLTNGISSFLS